MDVPNTSGPAGPVRLTAEQVAALLELAYTAHARMACEVDLILGSRAAVSQATVDRFARLATDLRPGAAARAELAALDPALLMAGTSLWMLRRRANPSAASARAAQRWSGGRSA